MDNIRLYSNIINTETHVSNRFIDEYMVEANGEFVKVYLYLLRCLNSANCNCSISNIADLFNHTEADIIRGIKYWEKQGLIAVEYGANEEIISLNMVSLTNKTSEPVSPADSQAAIAQNLQNIAGSQTTITQNIQNIADPQTTITQNIQNIADPQATITQSHQNISDPQTTITQNHQNITDSQININNCASVRLERINKASVKKEYTLDEIKTFKNDPDISELFFILEVYLKHPLSSSDINTILYWYDELHFTADLIVHLVEYCLSKNHSSIKYMDKVALNWAEHNITTVEQAKEISAAHSQIYYTVLKALGISGRNLVTSEMEFLNKWTKTYLFDNEIIEEACRRTISAIHQPSFEYTDTILSNWFKNQVHTLSDIKRLDEIYSKNKKVTVNTTDKPVVKRNKFNNFNQRNHDFDELEKVLLTTSVQ